MASRFTVALGLAGALTLLACGRTDLFSARRTCAPTDPSCQVRTDGGADEGARRTDGRAGDRVVDVRPADGRVDGNTCPTGTREICNNGIDDNCNGLVDCADPGCFGDVACATPGREICNNGIDDNGDGLVDCADPQCVRSLACRPVMGHEICDNGIDDNGDGLVDCADSQCTTFPGCLQLLCKPDTDFGTIAAHDAMVTRAVDTTGATQAYATCATPGGRGRVGRFVLTEDADVRLGFSQPTSAAHVVALFRAGASQACDRNPVTCVDTGGASTTTRTFPALKAGTYWLVVESYPGTPGATTVTLSTGSLKMPEICNNGIDDDGNGLIDCADLACVNAPNCATMECKPDTTLGALVVGDPAKNVRVDLTHAPSRYSPTCAGAAPGGDAAVAVTLAVAGGIEVSYRQSGQTIFSLFKQPGPGLACDNGDGQLGCAFEDQRAGAVAFSDLAAGRYVLIFKATGNANAGVLALGISAFQSRPVEICNNGIDDDGNGLIDCADPACLGIDGCSGPGCLPDTDVGILDLGAKRMVTVDTRGGMDLYPTTCSRGNGKERVVRVTLAQPMALGVDCTQTGSHVVEISQQVAPLDKCDAHALSCADPAVLPFGCGYSIPGLQPGQYNLIVQSFQAGDEGVVSIALSAEKEIIREICNNGIDDDKDGFIDCADRKCVTSPLCTMFACRPGKTLGLLPLNGSVVSALVETSGAGDNETHTACVSAPGGQDSDVDFQLPAKADVTLDWAQVGNHDFALYSDAGPLLSCEAGISFDCISSAGQATGTKIIPSLRAGSYHLVIDADKPGVEGGVALQLSAKPSM